MTPTSVFRGTSAAAHEYQHLPNLEVASEYPPGGTAISHPLHEPVHAAVEVDAALVALGVCSAELPVRTVSQRDAEPPVVLPVEPVELLAGGQGELNILSPL